MPSAVDLRVLAPWFGRSAKSIRVQVFGKTDVGVARTQRGIVSRRGPDAQGCVASAEVRQHDLGERGSLFVVADAWAVPRRGELASQMATDTILAHLLKAWNAETEATPQRFAHRLKNGRGRECEHPAHAKAHPEVRGMGTTTTAAGVLGDHLYLTQVGTAGRISCAAARHTSSPRSVPDATARRGRELTERSAHSERRNIILQALGPDPKVKVDLTHQEVRRGDVLVLCSERPLGPSKEGRDRADRHPGHRSRRRCDKP